MKNIIRSIKLLYKTSPLLMFLLGVFTTLPLFISPLFSLIDKLLFDTLQEGYNYGLDRKRILHLVLLYFTYNLSVFALFKIKDIINTYAQTVVGVALQKKTIHGMNKVEYERFEDNKFYNYIATVQKEISGGNILSLYLNVISFISVVMGTVFLCYLLYSLSIWAVLLSLFCCMPGFLHQTSFGKKNWEFNTSKIPLQRKTGYFFRLLSSVESYRENRIYGTIPEYKKKYSMLFDEFYGELKDFNGKNCLRGILMASLHALGTVMVITYSYYQGARGNITLGDAILFVGVCQSIYNNVQNGIYTIGSINESCHSVENILNFMSAFPLVEERKKNIRGQRQEKNVQIELFNVVYSYPNVEKRVLDGLSLTIRAGEKIAIVGENGSGKTTLAKLILGLYHPQEGNVKVNGEDIRMLPESFRYGSVSFQDFCTYSLSIRENVAFGNIERLDKEEEIRHAIDLSYLCPSVFDNDINKQVTKSFDSDGVVLSGGQAQKLSLARAFMFEDGLLVLDEPSAALDVMTENEIFASTLKLMEDRTTVVITHRLSNVVHCDRIVYLERGKICEEGTHEKLMKEKGRYAQLFNIQAQKYIVGS